MLTQIRQLNNISRFTDLTHDGADELRFRKFTLIYGRNGSGKSSLADILRAAGSKQTSSISERRTLGSTGKQILTLAFETGQPLRMNADQWSGPDRKFLVYDQQFIEESVFVGRRISKPQRVALLEIALGPTQAQAALLISQLSKSIREKNTEARTIRSRFATHCSPFGLTVDEFLALTTPENAEDLLEEAEKNLHLAHTQESILQKPRLTQLSGMPAPDFDQIEQILATNLQTIGTDATTAATSHFQNRLQGSGENWIKQGLQFGVEPTCPFCGQDTSEVELVLAYAQFFDQAYANHISDIETALESILQVDEWVTQSTSVFDRNKEVADQWSTDAGLQLAEFTTQALRDRVSETNSALTIQLRQKLAAPGSAVDAALNTQEAQASLRSLSHWIRNYSGVVHQTNTLASITQQQAGGLDLEQAQAQLNAAKAKVARATPEALALRSELTALEQDKDRLESEKEATLQNMRAETPEQLNQFRAVLNQKLERLGAEFSIEDPTTERTGGTPGLAFALRIGTERVKIASQGPGEAQFQSLLGEGDRNTLAFATFLTLTEFNNDLASTILVIDDPMTSFDYDRRRSTANSIQVLAQSASQVILLSHDPGFLALAKDHRTRLREVELELKKGMRALASWSSEDAGAHEYLRLWRGIHEFCTTNNREEQHLQIRGDIRKLLELYFRFRWPDRFLPRNTLESYVRQLQGNPRQLHYSDVEIEEANQLCIFSQEEHHGQGHQTLPPPTPQEVRTFANRALAWILL